MNWNILVGLLPAVHSQIRKPGMFWWELQHQRMKCFQWIGLMLWGQLTYILHEQLWQNCILQFYSWWRSWNKNRQMHTTKSTDREKKKTAKLKAHMIPGSSHCLSLASPSSAGCSHVGKCGDWWSWISWMWFARLVHLATIISPSPSGVLAAVQYRWLTIDFLQGLRDSHPFSFDKASIFFPSPGNTCKLTNWQREKNFFNVN